jgi:hypothetical protein
MQMDVGQFFGHGHPKSGSSITRIIVGEIFIDEYEQVSSIPVPGDHAFDLMIGKQPRPVIEIDALGFFDEDDDVNRQRSVRPESLSEVGRRDSLEISNRVSANVIVGYRFTPGFAFRCRR